MIRDEKFQRIQRFFLKKNAIFLCNKRYKSESYSIHDSN